MSARRVMTAAEVAVLTAQLPEKLTPDMRSVAVAMFEALVLLDRAQAPPGLTAPGSSNCSAGPARYWRRCSTWRPR